MAVKLFIKESRHRLRETWLRSKLQRTAQQYDALTYAYHTLEDFEKALKRLKSDTFLHLRQRIVSHWVFSFRCKDRGFLLGHYLQDYNWITEIISNPAPGTNLQEKKNCWTIEQKQKQLWPQLRLCLQWFALKNEPERKWKDAAECGHKYLHEPRLKFMTILNMFDFIKTGRRLTSPPYTKW